MLKRLERARTEAQWLVVEVRKLHLIEAHAREQGMTAEQPHGLRQQLARPILQGIKNRLEELQPTLLPQSSLGKAVTHALEECPKTQLHRKEELVIFRTSRGWVARRGDLLDHCQLPQAKDRPLGISARYDATAASCQEPRNPGFRALKLESIRCAHATTNPKFRKSLIVTGLRRFRYTITLMWQFAFALFSHATFELYCRILYLAGSG